jgi:hypothetical protein
MDKAKPTVFRYRPHAKYPWSLKQGHNEVKLTKGQAADLLWVLVDKMVQGD